MCVGECAGFSPLQPFETAYLVSAPPRFRLLKKSDGVVGAGEAFDVGLHFSDFGLEIPPLRSFRLGSLHFPLNLPECFDLLLMNRFKLVMEVCV